MATTLTTARKAENKISFDATQTADVRRCLHLGRAEDGPVRTTVKLRPARWSQLTNSWVRSDRLKLVRQEELPRASLFAADQLSCWSTVHRSGSTSSSWTWWAR